MRVPEARVREAVRTIQAGGVLLYPAEGVYGLGGDAVDPAVAARIRALKGRDADRPFLALVDHWARVRPWVQGLTPVHEALMRLSATDSRALTLLLPASPSAPAHLQGPEGLVGVRLTHDPLCRALVQGADQSLSSTSANRSGQATPARFADVDARIRQGVDRALDGGSLQGQPSTVVAVAAGRLDVRREGAFPASELAAVAPLAA